MIFTINDKSNYFDDSFTESPIESLFFTEIVKHLEVGTKIEPQREYITQIGKFRVDFLIRKGTIEYVIELDGKAYHKKQNDVWRDSFLLGENKVKTIIRIKGKDVIHNLNECLYFLSQIFPNTFSERGKINLATLLESENKKAIDQNLNENIYQSIDKYYLPTVLLEDDKIKSFPSIEINFMNQKKFIYWKKYYNYAIRNRIFNVEELSKSFFS